MATRIAWWLNLDSDLELAQPGRYRRHPQLEGRLGAFVKRLNALLLPEDIVLAATGSAAARGPICALAFCPTPSALRALAEQGFAPPASPPLSVLRTVTRRGFATRLGQTLKGARYVRDLTELAGAIEAPSPSGEWLLKRDFSFAGRERRRIRGGQLDVSTLGFAKRSFARGEGLQVEPYVERDADFAQHGYLLAGGELLIGPPMLQRCDARGVWQESMPLTAGSLDASDATALADSVRAAGHALGEAGYFGPYGVDAFRYHCGDQLTFQPRSEVNARFTMGFPRALLERALALGGTG